MTSEMKWFRRQRLRLTRVLALDPRKHHTGTWFCKGRPPNSSMPIAPLALTQAHSTVALFARLDAGSEVKDPAS